MEIPAADLARGRRGLKLNYPQTIALITCGIMEEARDGCNVGDLPNYGTSIVKKAKSWKGWPG